MEHARGQGVLLAVLMVVGAGGASPKVARADEPFLGKGTRTVLRTGLYGALAGTAVGLASVPFNRQARSIFIGSSTGLYLGLAVGLFLAWEESEPEDYARELKLRESVRQHAQQPDVKAATPLYARVTVLRF